MSRLPARMALAALALVAALPAAGAVRAPADEGSLIGGVSSNGRYVLVESTASNLAPGDTNGSWDWFVRDRVTATTERANVSSAGEQARGGGSGQGVISGNGRFVVFDSSASNLVAADLNGATDVFVRDRVTKKTERVSVGSGGAEANGSSSVGSVSPDGRFVTFSSTASNLVASDTNDVEDTFLRDRLRGTTERVSVASGGIAGNRASGSGRVTADGRLVAFGSESSNLTGGTATSGRGVFVRDRATRTTELIVGQAAILPERNVLLDAMSDDGRVLVVEASGSVYVIDRVARTRRRICVQKNGKRVVGWCGDAVLSANGRFVAFDTATSAHPANFGLDFQDVFVRDRATGSTERISVTSTGTAANAGSNVGGVTADGRYVAFQSTASNLVAGDVNECGDDGDHANCSDVFLRDRVGRTTSLITVGIRILRLGPLRLTPWPPRAGRTLIAATSASAGATPADTVDVTCTATLSGRELIPTGRSYGRGIGRCVWKIPGTARGRLLRGYTILWTTRGAIRSPFAGTVR